MNHTLILGGTTLFVACVGLTLLSPSSVALDMAAHMTIVAAAAPLVAATLVHDGLPRFLDGIASRPLPLTLVELVIVWFWHFPRLHILSGEHPFVGLVEQASFFAAGILLWTSCFLPGNRAQGVIALLLTPMHMTLLGVLVALAPRVLFTDADQVTCLGVVLSPETDQQIGGVVMLLVGALAYLAGGLRLLFGLVHDRTDATADTGRER